MFKCTYLITIRNKKINVCYHENVYFTVKKFSSESFLHKFVGNSSVYCLTKEMIWATFHHMIYFFTELFGVFFLLLLAVRGYNLSMMLFPLVLSSIQVNTWHPFMLYLAWSASPSCSIDKWWDSRGLVYSTMSRVQVCLHMVHGQEVKKAVTWKGDWYWSCCFVSETTFSEIKVPSRTFPYGWIGAIIAPSICQNICRYLGGT